ncbi:hypothetical protein [Kineosporia babensis]|uniref:Uncharacterized protein n=1 Tax=Kineosporia babensis TaxID=499548 RepID=A0A9X1NDI2_9ACTN|nr:hypothetical protein [Kineosporia babensis]MCD5311790.1 hypothetical protein [Kineosporia babensis]
MHAVGYLADKSGMLWTILLTAVVMALMSMTKGWWLFYLIPALPFVVAVEFATQDAAMIALRKRGGPNEMSKAMAVLIETLAAVQLLAAAVTYFCLPSLADTTASTAFLFVEADMHTLIVKLSWIVTLVSASVAVGTTIALGMLLAALRKRSRPADRPFQGFS